MLPGVVSLEIGNNFTTLFQFPAQAFDPTSQNLKLTFPTSTNYTGLTAWFEAAYLRNPLPVPTTNAFRVTLN